MKNKIKVYLSKFHLLYNFYASKASIQNSMTNYAKQNSDF